MSIEDELTKRHFRVAIFGSARIQKNDPIYTIIYTLSKMISNAEMDIVTGGGLGLMNAANEGHHAGRKGNLIHSVGLKVNLQTEKHEYSHLDIKKEFHRFSNRLDSFMQLSNVVVVASGGVGTLLELFYTWQLMQVKQICNVHIILLGDMWCDLVSWIRNWPLKNNLLSDIDIELLFIAKNCTETFNIIQEAYKGYKKGDDKFCLNYKKYKI